MGGVRARRVGLGAVLATLLLAPVAEAASPLKIREAFPGSSGTDAKAEFVELQMTADGQADIDGQVLHFYGSAGTEAASYAIPSDVASGASQRSVLLATAEAAAIGAGSPDFTLPSADRMDPAGGAICLTGASPSDCLAWGTFPPSDPFSPLIPDPQSANAVTIPDGQSLSRDISRGCATILDAPDDTGSSVADFDPAAPDPRSNATAPSEVRCPPDTVLLTSPENPNNDPSASFTYAELPAEPGRSFECRLDGAAFGSCPLNGVSYAGPLSEGSHSFMVRAIGEGGPDPTPKLYTWEVDLTAPQTAVTSTPPEPSSGFEAAFGFSSSESQSSFRCQLDDGAIQLCANNASQGMKSYFDLTDGAHTFRVWATDNAGNKDPSPAAHGFTVFTPLGDRTAPDTAIISAPSSPAASSSAFFAYSSSEPGSTFQCRLGGGEFAACPDTGIRYEDLPNAGYRFEVRAVDRAGNVDSVPAAHSWRVAAPLPNTKILRGPPGRVSLGKGRRAKRKIVLVFRADRPGVSFRCALNRRKPRPCGARKRIVIRKPGRYRFTVYAIDALGNVETTPARRVWRVTRRGKSFFGGGRTKKRRHNGHLRK